ncbi:unnamed protein product [Lepidochelys kempii]
MSLSRTETGAELWQSGRGREVVPQGSIFATDGMCLSRINDDGSRTQRLHATWQMLWIEGGVRVSAICSTVFPLLISITPVLPRLSMSQLLSMQVPISQRHCDILVLASLERRCPEDNVLHFLSYPISEMQSAPGGVRKPANPSPRQTAEQFHTVSPGFVRQQGTCLYEHCK